MHYSLPPQSFHFKNVSLKDATVHSLLDLLRTLLFSIVANSFHHLLIWGYPLFPTQYHTDFISKTCQCPAAERTCSFHFLWTSNYKSCKTKLLVLHIFMPESKIKQWFRYHSICSTISSLFLIYIFENYLIW